MLIIYYILAVLYFAFLFSSMATFIIMKYNPFNDEDIINLRTAQRNAKMMEVLMKVKQPVEKTFRVDHYINYSDTLADLYRLENVNIGDIVFIKNMQAYYMHTNDLKFVKMDVGQQDVVLINTYLISCIGAFITIESRRVLGILPEKETVKNIYFI